MGQSTAFNNDKISDLIKYMRCNNMMTVINTYAKNSNQRISVLLPRASNPGTSILLPRASNPGSFILFPWASNPRTSILFSGPQSWDVYPSQGLKPGDVLSLPQGLNPWLSIPPRASNPGMSILLPCF
jgi:hypothetical protein